MSKFKNNPENTQRVKNIPLKKYGIAKQKIKDAKYAFDHQSDTDKAGKYKSIHDQINDLVNGEYSRRQPSKMNINGNRCTVIITVPKKLTESAGSHAGHCGVVLWDSVRRTFQSAGITMQGAFQEENINARLDSFYRDDRFDIWYFTKEITPTVYEKLQKKMNDFRSGSIKAAYRVYGNFSKLGDIRGKKGCKIYNCVTSADSILCAGGLSKGVAAMTTTPLVYAQTFTRQWWNISCASGHRHISSEHEIE